MNDFEKKIQQMAMITAEEDVRTISGVLHGCWYYSKNSRVKEVENINKFGQTLNFICMGE